MAIGDALSKHPRKSFNLATKIPSCPEYFGETKESIFFEQLKKCKVEYFDYYLLHNLNKWSLPDYERNNIYEFLKEQKNKGYIRHLGFSFHDTPKVLQEIISKYDFDFAQIQLNYMDWELQDAKTQYQILNDKSIPIIVMEPARGGGLVTLCDKSVEILKKANPDASVVSWALRYAASFPNVLSVLTGVKNLQELQENITYFEHFEPLNQHEYTVIDKALVVYKNNFKIPCTACRYCMDCPHGVDIPGAFEAYNMYLNTKRNSKNTGLDEYRFRTAILGPYKQANSCIQCKRCVKLCPQHINIPYLMSEITKFNIKTNEPVWKSFVKNSVVYRVIRRLFKNK
jgi:predicted aldo/keto reductase-like oxidoreductase